MADNKNLLLLGAAGVAAWYFFFRTPALPATVVPIAGPNPNSKTGGPDPKPDTTTTKPDPLAGNTLAGVYGKMVAASGLGPDDRLGADGWDYYLNQVLSPLGYAAPDPMSVFGVMLMGQDRSAQFKPAEYWAVMGPAIKTKTGLTGLGFFGGSGLRGWVQ